jgi:hypothetical protein
MHAACVIMTMMHLSNVGKLLSDYTALQTKTQPSSFKLQACFHLNKSVTSTTGAESLSNWTCQPQMLH